MVGYSATATGPSSTTRMQAQHSREMRAVEVIFVGIPLFGISRVALVPATRSDRALAEVPLHSCSPQSKAVVDDGQCCTGLGKGCGGLLEICSSTVVISTLGVISETIVISAVVGDVFLRHVCGEHCCAPLLRCAPTGPLWSERSPRRHCCALAVPPLPSRTRRTSLHSSGL